VAKAAALGEHGQQMHATNSSITTGHRIDLLHNDLGEDGTSLGSGLTGEGDLFEYLAHGEGMDIGPPPPSLVQAVATNEEMCDVSTNASANGIIDGTHHQQSSLADMQNAAIQTPGEFSIESPLGIVTCTFNQCICVVSSRC
jgi:hypothetical protein